MVLAISGEKSSFLNGTTFFHTKKKVSILEHIQTFINMYNHIFYIPSYTNRLSFKKDDFSINIPLYIPTYLRKKYDI